MEYKKRKKAILLLSDGTIFYGKSVSGEGYCIRRGMLQYWNDWLSGNLYRPLLILVS